MQPWKNLFPSSGPLTVKQQIGLAMAALVVATVAAIAGSTGWLGARQTAAFVRQDLAGAAQVFADRLDRTVATRYREIQILVGLEPLQPVWRGDQPTLRGVLDQLQGSYSDYSWIGFVTPDGVVRAATQGMLEGVSVAERTWFKNALRAPAVEDVHEAMLLAKLLGPKASGEPFRFVDIAFPVLDGEGRTLGVLGVHLSWDFAAALRHAMLKTVDPASATELLVLGRDGKVLLGGTAGSAPFSASELAAIRSSRRGTLAMDDGPRRLIAAFAGAESRLDYPSLGWTVVARQPYDTALAPVSVLVWTIAGIGLVAGALAIAIALMVAGRIARPLQRLTAEADAVGRDPRHSMLSRHAGSVEVVQLSTALRSLLRRVGFAEQKTHEVELRLTEGVQKYERDIRLLKELADTDPLTNLMNRRAFLTTAADAFDYFRRYDRAICILMIDIDHFKRINDTHGHPAGDAVIRSVGQAIEASLRGTDKVARFGGEEFVVLLREVTEQDTAMLARRINETVAAEPVLFGEARMPVTVSVGMSMAVAADRDVQDTIERADQGLYMAKNTGRNRVFHLRASSAATTVAATSAAAA